jgi:hypothetical protein
LVLNLVVVASTSAFAQELPPARVGGGLSFITGGGIGLAGGVVVPVKQIGPRTLGVVGALGVHKFDGYSLLSFGGGLRSTRQVPQVTQVKNFRVFVQGMLGVSQSRFEGFSDSAKGFTIGGGAGFALNPRVDLFGELDITTVLPGEGGLSYHGIATTIGVSVPIGSK